MKAEGGSESQKPSRNFITEDAEEEGKARLSTQRLTEGRKGGEPFSGLNTCPFCGLRLKGSPTALAVGFSSGVGVSRRRAFAKSTITMTERNHTTIDGIGHEQLHFTDSFYPRDRRYRGDVQPRPGWFRDPWTLDRAVERLRHPKKKGSYCTSKTSRVIGGVSESREIPLSVFFSNFRDMGVYPGRLGRRLIAPQYRPAKRLYSVFPRPGGSESPWTWLDVTRGECQ